MDAIVLVGGQGTRLRPLTANRHKSLVPVCNRPAIEYLFNWLRDSGVTRIVLALGLSNEDLAEAYPAGMRDGVQFVTVFEKQRLESGGAIRYAVEQTGIEETFLVLNGDVYLDFDLRAAIARHQQADALVSLALTPVDDPSQFGVAIIDEANWIRGFHEKPPRGQAPSNLVNAGAWIFEKAAVDLIPPGAVRVEETLFPSLAERGRLLGYQFAGPWADIGTPERYLALNQQLAASIDGSVSADVRLDPSAVLIASSIGSGTDVGARAVIEGSIIWEQVHVGTGASVVNSIVADGVTIGAEANLDGAVVGHGCTIAPGVSLPPHTVLQPGSTFDGE